MNRMAPGWKQPQFGEFRSERHMDEAAAVRPACGRHVPTPGG